MDRLTTTPPELLLQILSHLPLRTLSPLSQVSAHLSTFLHTHAASICNTHILTYYSHASRILKSAYTKEGWLLPTHLSIIAEERRLLRDKILFAGCRCPPCRVVVSSSSNSSLSLSELESGFNLNCLGIIRAPMCKAREAIESCLKLSAPGPQYLVFLEKYSWEIETRWAMANFGASPGSGTSSSNDTIAVSADDNGVGGDTEMKEKEKEAAFQFMIGNYCVRRFLESAEKAVAAHSSLSLANDTRQMKRRMISLASGSTFVNTDSKLRRFGKMIARVLKGKARKEEVVKEVVGDTEPRERGQRTQASSPRRLMFGEISPSPPSSSDEKAQLITTQSRKREERWEDGLLWYYSSRGSGTVDVDVVETAEVETAEAEEEEHKERKRSCFSAFRKGIEGLGRKMAGMVKGKRCFGGFRVLDG